MSSNFFNPRRPARHCPRNRFDLKKAGGSPSHWLGDKFKRTGYIPGYNYREFSCCLWLCLFLFPPFLITVAHGQNQHVEIPDFQNVELPHAARVVFVGNSLIGEAGQYGILEWLFSNAWPDNNLTFRNLGWSGDTADGKARSYISQPPAPFELLIQQIDTLHPDLVVIGYGGVEADQGAGGLEAFGENLDRLIRKIDSLGAQSILLSPIPQFSPEEVPVDMTERNENLELYSGKIREVARQHNKLFVDLFPAFQQCGRSCYSENGFHLDGNGYYRMGELILNAMGHPQQDWNLGIDARTQEIISSEGVEVEVENISRTEIDLRIRSGGMPVLVDGENMADRKLIVRGLKKGIYRVMIDEEHILAASSSDLTDGVLIRQGPLFDRAERIQEMYGEINDLYFWEYRPLNRTYLVGFRKHEQGQNSYELELNSLFIDRLEKKISQLKERKFESFRIERIK